VNTPLTEPVSKPNRGFETASYPKSLFKIWIFGVANAKILPCRHQKSPKIGIFAVYYRKNPQFEQALSNL
jgi:hypothetical protein